MARNIKAGDLRQVIVLQRPVVTIGEHNRRNVEFQDAVTVHAAMADVSGREFWEAQAYHAEDVVTFTIRWRNDLDATWRVKRGETVYNILEVNHLGYMRDFMRLKCKTVGAGGV